MIIIEQDKGYFINYNNTTTVTVAVDEIDKEYAIIANTITKKEPEVVLGVYKTEKRAKEVLDDIVNTRAVFEMYKCIDSDAQNIFDEKMLEEHLIFDTYQMPEN